VEPWLRVFHFHDFGGLPYPVIVERQLALTIPANLVCEMIKISCELFLEEFFKILAERQSTFVKFRSRVRTRSEEGNFWAWLSFNQKYKYWNIKYIDFRFSY
jgi:hypothetical protein